MSRIVLAYEREHFLNNHKLPPEVLIKKGALKNLAKFTGKHLCWSLLIIKVAGQNFENFGQKFRSTTRYNQARYFSERF